MGMKWDGAVKVRAAVGRGWAEAGLEKVAVVRVMAAVVRVTAAVVRVLGFAVAAGMGAVAAVAKAD